jgi:predicted phosphodiesterase
MLLIGDIHGCFQEYRKIIRESKAKKSLQLGDYGLGFPNSQNHFDISDEKGTHLFIRGNHDNPAVCRADKFYAGDYGVIKGKFINKNYDKLFFISGAWSIDQEYRTENISWWKDEQLSPKELESAINKYKEEEPDIVCSHDCPTVVLYYIHPGRVIPTRTSQAMDEMFLFRKPSYWFFAHHHMSWRKNIDGCTFVCLNEFEAIDISNRIVNIPQGD